MAFRTRARVHIEAGDIKGFKEIDSEEVKDEVVGADEDDVSDEEIKEAAEEVDKEDNFFYSNLARCSFPKLPFDALLKVSNSMSADGDRPERYDMEATPYVKRMRGFIARRDNLSVLEAHCCDLSVLQKISEVTKGSIEQRKLEAMCMDDWDELKGVQLMRKRYSLIVAHRIATNDQWYQAYCHPSEPFSISGSL